MTESPFSGLKYHSHIFCILNVRNGLTKKTELSLHSYLYLRNIYNKQFPAFVYTYISYLINHKFIGRLLPNLCIQLCSWTTFFHFCAKPLGKKPVQGVHQNLNTKCPEFSRFSRAHFSKIH